MYQKEKWIARNNVKKMKNSKLLVDFLKVYNKIQLENLKKRQFGRRTTVATGNTREERSSRGKNVSERSYQRKNNGTGERGGFNKTYSKPYNKPKDGVKPYQKRFDKDKDESDYRGNNGYRGKDNGRNGEHRGSRPSASRETTKIKEQQPDKMDIVKRLEKEKKAMQKKSSNQNSAKNRANAGRVQRPVKRSNNIDWTKEYENDSYDDDDMSYIY